MKTKPTDIETAKSYIRRLEMMQRKEIRAMERLIHATKYKKANIRRKNIAALDAALVALSHLAKKAGA